MIKDDILRRIQNYWPNLSQAQQKIAHYILNNTFNIPKMTISELANETGASAASIVRFCQLLEVKSFSLLKVEIASALREEKLETFDFEPDESMPSITHKLLESSYQSMKDTVHYLTPEILQAFDAVVDSADVVYTFGVGASRLVAKNIAQKWSRAGKLFICEQDAHMLTTRLVGNDLKKALILVSNTGKTKSVLNVLKVAQQNNIKVISISRLGDNPLAQQADVAVKTVDADESEFRSAATSSLHVQFFTVDVLFFNYISKRYEQTMHYIRKTRENVNTLKI